MKLTITITKNVEDYEEAGAILLQIRQSLKNRPSAKAEAIVTEPVEIEPG